MLLWGTERLQQGSLAGAHGDEMRGVGHYPEEI